MNNATLTNRAYSSTYRQLNQTGKQEGFTIMSNFKEDDVLQAWVQFCNLVSKNYEVGRGTIVPRFGTFTYQNSEVSLEGTTNQQQRDKKAKKPVFIVSSEFVEFSKPAIWTPLSGLIQYSQKKNSNMSHVKVNYAEISLGIGLSKGDTQTIIENTLRLVADSIKEVTN